MNRIKNLNLAAKIIIAVCLVLFLILGGLNGYIFYNMYLLNVDQSQKRVLSLAELEAKQLTRTFEHMTSSLQSMSGKVMLMKDYAYADRDFVIDFLKDELKRNKEVLALYTLWEPDAFDGRDNLYKDTVFHDDTGRFVPYIARDNYNNIVIDPLVNYKKIPEGNYYQIPKKSKEFSMLEPYLYPVAGKNIMIISLVQPLLDKNNKFLGILGADFSLDFLQQSLEELDTMGGHAAIISENGRYIAHSSSSEKMGMLSKRQFEAIPVSEEKMVQSQNDKNFIFIYPIKFASNDKVWYFEMVIPHSAVFANITENFYKSIIISILGIILTALIIFLIIRYLITDNIKQLVKSLKEVAAGKLDERINVNSSYEFDMLTKFFNTMVEKRKAAEEILDFQASHDILTGIYNRSGFKKLLKLLCEERKTPFVLYFIDLDYFKIVNDTINHTAGDTILKEVSKRIREFVPDEGVLARFGGDEFIILLPYDLSKKEINNTADNLLNVIAEPYNIEGQKIFVTASIGSSKRKINVNEIDEFINEADAAMYIAKKKRNTHCRYEPFMGKSASRNMFIEKKLQTALQNNELELFFQPIVDINNGKMLAAEALLRWKQPEKGYIPPVEFIPVAESSRLIISIGNWVIEEVCRYLDEWRKEGLQQITIGINLSMVQFQQNNILIEHIKKCLHKYDIEPDKLDFELTESVLMQNPFKVISVLNQIRTLGCSVSLDDFGTGYSSLSYLKSLPIDTLKLDRSFILFLQENSKDTVIVSSVINIAHCLGLNILTEGIETEEQLQQLQKMNCNFAQGYYFSRPEPTKIFKKRLS